MCSTITNIYIKVSIFGVNRSYYTINAKKDVLFYLLLLLIVFIHTNIIKRKHLMPNHLKNETSSYVEAYTNKPIHWYPWGVEAITKAQTEHKPIFIFVAYHGSYFAQIMREESFSNPHIIELLNEHFISIIVDKDERGDIEKHCQEIYYLMNRRRGGSPLSIFMSENLEPFYATSYISPEAQQEQLGFEELLRVISNKYITDQPTLIEKGQEVLNNINPKKQTIEATKLNKNILLTIKSHVENLLDTEFGGFGIAAKFPNTSTFDLLLNVYHYTNDESLLSATTLTLDAMKNSPIYNKNLFHHFSTDREWNSPSPEITLFDNAALSKLYLHAYEVSGNLKYKRVAFEILDAIQDQLSNTELFYSRLNHEVDPSLDKQIVTSWNAMTISALLKAGVYEKKYTKQAILSLEKILEKLYINGKLFHSTSIDKFPKTAAFLEDYAYLGEALIDAYIETSNINYLKKATDFANCAIEEFYSYGEWNFSNEEFNIKESIFDTTYPSSLSTILSLLMSVSTLGEVEYQNFIFKTLEINSYSLMRQPLSSPKLTNVLLRYLHDDMLLKSNKKLDLVERVL